MKHHLVLRVVTKLMIPFILIFGLYVQFHGDFGPGGGFQAGVIIAAAFILYALVFGLEEARKVVPDGALRILVPAGVLIFAGTGVATLLMGGKFLDYDVLRPSDTGGQHLGIWLVEFGVGTTVAAVMIAIFFTYAARPHQIDDEDW
ncbi:MAG: Na(+)/H(+) antiporter subunit B [Rhodospirillaceae bacterium]|nr:Na(+)/H(+) antiporter subunit B [Rhodospirillaceae bacterium]MBT6137531.1 Na(+)/H(+) antiporter subunit B [Rhodospirillaceae bacterium]